MHCGRTSVVLAAFMLIGASLAVRAADAPPPVIPPVQDAPREAPTKPGDYKYKFVARVDGKPVQMTYVLILPKGYDTASPQTKFPMIVFMHGSGEVGTDGEGCYVHGPAAQLRYHADFRENFPFIVLCPQCPPRGERWDQPQMYKAVSLIVDAAIKSVRADPDRVYLTGLSMGGKGCWLAALEGADRFAAIAPICAGSVHPDAAQKLKYVTVWMIDGALDTEAVNAATQMSGILKNNLAEVRVTTLPNRGHDVWPDFYANDQFYEWLLTHKRPTAEERRKMDAAGPFAQQKPAMPRTPGHYRVVIPADIGGVSWPIQCGVYVPKGYTPTGTKRSPMIVFLHENHSIGTLAGGAVVHGPAQALELPGNSGMKDDFPFVVVSPMCPIAVGDWSKPETARAVVKCVDELTRAMNVDPTRVYAMGLNEGGAGAWQLALADPKRFAAIVPMVAQGNLPPPGEVSAKLKAVPTWAFVPQSEQGVEDATKRATEGFAEAKVTAVGATTLAQQDAAFADKALYDWLLKHVKK